MVIVEAINAVLGASRLFVEWKRLQEEKMRAEAEARAKALRARARQAQACRSTAVILGGVAVIFGIAALACWRLGKLLSAA